MSLRRKIALWLCPELVDRAEVEAEFRFRGIRDQQASEAADRISAMVRALDGINSKLKKWDRQGLPLRGLCDKKSTNHSPRQL